LGHTYPLSALLINPLNSSLILGSNHLGIIEYRETKDHTGQECLTSHDALVSHVLYNPLFDLVRIPLSLHCNAIFGVPYPQIS